MPVDARQSARVVDAMASTHPRESGLAVDWQPPGSADWRRWSRYASGSSVGTRWPGAERSDFSVVALNKVRQATLLALTAAAACLREGGALYLFGQNDLGIRSFSTFRDVGFDTVDVGAHGRLLRWRGQVESEGPGLESFRSVRPLDVPSVGRIDWVDYPGCFAGGRVDAGTVLLLDSLDGLAPVGGPVYDFACGSGVVSRSVGGRWPGVSVFGSDADAISVHAAAQNVPGARFVVADGWAYPASEVPKLVLSNPPFHFGRARDHGVCFAFIEQAALRLAADGELRIVVQREVVVEPALRALFKDVRRPIAAPGYSVWSAREPMRVLGKP